MPTDTRRRVAYRSQAGACSLKVPIWHHNPEGEWIEGRITVSARLAHAEPNSNQAHERDNEFRKQLRAWAEYREKRGWTMVSRPKIRGPVTPPTATTRAHPNEDVIYYFALARFTRSEPMFVGLDDFLYQQDLMKLHGIAPEKDPLPWNDVRGGGSEEWVEPLVVAEERRRKLGVKRSDYVIPELWSKEALEALHGR